MTDSVNWKGASGASYVYSVHKLPWRPAANQKGNYIFAKAVNNYWHPVYIGQGDLQERYDAALKEGCVRDKAATHYHVHTQNDKAARENEESDLIAGNPKCKWPEGCNGHD